MPSAMPSASGIEVVTSVQRRRRFTLSEKLRAVEAAAQPGITVSYVARQYGIAPSLLFRWRRLMAEGGKEAIRGDEDVVGASRVRELEQRIRELERLLGKKTLENELLREALELARSKKLLSRKPLPPAEDTP